MKGRVKLVPKITIIMGTYNCENLYQFNESIHSIINQSFEDWKLVICDDGSRQEVFEKIASICKVDSRIKLIRHTRNQGLAAALNSSLAISDSQYIARQDDDDISQVSRLEEQIAFLDAHPEYAFVGTNANMFDSRGVWNVFKLEDQPTKYSFRWNSPFIHPSILIRTRALKNVGGYHVTKITRRCEDYDLFMRLYANGYFGYNLQKSLYSYRVDRNTVKSRAMKYRIDEARVRFRGFRSLGILWSSLFYIIKPILIGLLPVGIYRRVWKSISRK